MQGIIRVNGKWIADITVGLEGNPGHETAGIWIDRSAPDWTAGTAEVILGTSVVWTGEVREDDQLGLLVSSHEIRGAVCRKIRRQLEDRLRKEADLATLLRVAAII